MGEIDRRLEQLIREVEGAGRAASPPPRQPSAANRAAPDSAPSSEGSPDRSRSSAGRPTGSRGGRWLPAFLVLLLCNLLQRP